MKEYRNFYHSPIGNWCLTSDGTCLTAVSFVVNTIPKNADDELDIFEETKKWLDIYFSGKCPDFMPNIKLNGTPFQMSVWNILKEIPYGKTVTYGEIANKIAIKRGIERMSAQAVGGAVGRNPITIIVPCHRVIGANGALVGYEYGTKIKAKLLELENCDKFVKDNR